MPREQDFEGHRAPASRERVGLLAAVTEYIDAWQRATGAEPRPAAARLQELNQRASELQQRSVSAGFGGLGHHVAEYSRLLSAGADLARLRHQLGIVSELAAQATQTLTPEERASLNAAVSRGPALGGAAAVAPPPLITIMRPSDAGPAAAALRAAPAELGPPKRLDAAAHDAVAPVAPAAWPVAPTPPPARPALASPPPARPPVPAAAQFSVKNMLGLRAFNRDQPAEQARAGTPKPAQILSRPALPTPGTGASRSSAPPPMVRSGLMGLPHLAADESGPYVGGGRRSAPSGQRMSPIPGPSRSSASTKPPARATPGRPAAKQLRVRRDSSHATWWVVGAGALVLAGTALAAFLVLGRRPARSPSDVSVTATTTHAADPGSPSPQSSVATAPRERLLADDERFMSLLAQVHGHGASESPELRSLLNEQAALASKALRGKCSDGSFRCKAWSDVRELLVGNRKPSIVRRRRGSDTESTRSRWMTGLKMPGIPVEDDPRVLRVFEFYTQNPVGRETFQSMLFRCGAYRDLIQSTLIRYDLPPELLALVFAESGCEPSAKSPVGAAGLWQFMPETGRAYHLKIIEGTIDERYSPFKSTEAGIRMLADLRLKLGSWDLVFASYNLGPFGVLARLERAGPDASFWDLVDADLLPDETANYAPTVQALALILANLQRLKFAGVQIKAPQLTADLEVAGGTRLSLVARAAATSVAQLRALNLDFSGDVVPLIPGGSIAVQVPKDVVWQARDALKDLLASKDGADQCVSATFDWGKQRFTPEMIQACQRRLSSAARETP